MKRTRTLNPELRTLNSGFTLVEMAVVLIVIGLVMLTVFPALTAVRTSSERALTQSNLQALMTATAAYVQANGCVPCPMPPTSRGGGFGHVRGDTSPAACGACTSPEGIAPFSSLGIPVATARDGWGHWISMRIDPLLANPPTFVAPPTKPVACTCSLPTAGVCTPTPSDCTCAPAVNSACAPLPAGLSQQGLCTAGLSTSSGAVPVQVTIPGAASHSYAVLFVSYGAQGFGSFVASASLAQTQVTRLGALQGPCTIATGFAYCNADGANQFVDAPQAPGYDDMLFYADRNTLVSMLDGGSCQTVW